MRNLLIAIALLASPAAAAPPGPTAQYGVDFLRLDPTLIASGHVVVFRDSTDGLVKIHNPDNTLTEIAPGYATRYAANAFSSTGSTLQVQAGIGGGLEWIRILPNDALPTAPWSCTFGFASNAPGPKNDAQVTCGWDLPGAPLYDPAQAGTSWSQENFCAEGTGCSSWTRQEEWYRVFSPPRPASAPAWLSNHAYLSGDFVTNGGIIYLAIADGTSGNTGPTGLGEGVVDGTVTWRAYVGFRFDTMNGRITDGELAFGLVGSGVCIGSGHTINDANMICAVGGNDHGQVQLASADQQSGYTIPSDNQSQQWFVPGLGAAAMQLSNPNGDIHGAAGLGIRVALHSYAGDGALSIGDHAGLGIGRFGYLSALSLYLGQSAVFPPFDVEGHILFRWSDFTTRPSLLRVFVQDTIVGSGFGGRTDFIPMFDIWWSDAGQFFAGNGTYDLGNPVCTSFNDSAAGAPASGGSYSGIKLNVVTVCTNNNVTSTIELVGTQNNDEAPINLHEVYHWPAAGGPLGTGIAIGARASTPGTWCFQPTVTISDGGRYLVKHNASGNSLTQ